MDAEIWIHEGSLYFRSTLLGPSRKIPQKISNDPFGADEALMNPEKQIPPSGCFDLMSFVSINKICGISFVGMNRKTSSLGIPAELS